MTLQKQGHTIEEKYPGIYYVTEHLPFSAQIIVTQELEPESIEVCGFCQTMRKRRYRRIPEERGRNEYTA